MQLRYYFAIVWRFWGLIVFLPLIVGALSVVITLREPQRYGATARLIVTQAPHSLELTKPFPDINLNFSWESTEFILDDLPQVVSSVTFSQDVSALLASQGHMIAPMAVQSGLRAERFHRSVSLFAEADTSDAALQIVRGAVETLQHNGLHYWDRRNEDQKSLGVAILDPPQSSGSLRGLRTIALHIGLRVGLALVTALGLAFLLHYLDDTLRSSRQAEEWTGMRVMGVIPRE